MSQKCSFILTSGANKGYECGKSSKNEKNLDGKYYCGLSTNKSSHEYKMLQTKPIIEKKESDVVHLPNLSVIDKIEQNKNKEIEMEKLNENDIYFNRQFNFIYDRSKNIVIGKFKDDPNLMEKIEFEDVILFEALNLIVDEDAILPNDFTEELDESDDEDDGINVESEDEEVDEENQEDEEIQE